MSVELHQLEQQLNILPGKIREQKLVVVEKEKELENAKLEYDVCFGMTLTGSKAPNATEKKAMAVISSQAEAEKVIACKYNLKKEEAGLKFLEDKFTAIRKIASLEIESYKTQPNVT